MNAPETIERTIARLELELANAQEAEEAAFLAVATAKAAESASRNRQTTSVRTKAQQRLARAQERSEAIRGAIRHHEKDRDRARAIQAARAAEDEQLRRLARR